MLSAFGTSEYWSVTFHSREMILQNQSVPFFSGLPMAERGESTPQDLQLQTVAKHPLHTQKQAEWENAVPAICWWQVTCWHRRSIPTARWCQNYEELNAAASVTRHFCCAAPVAQAAATRPSPSPAFSTTTVQNAGGPKDSSTAGCWYNPDFVGPETPPLCTGLRRGAQWVAHPRRAPLLAFKLSTPCLKSAIIT